MFEPTISNLFSINGIQNTNFSDIKDEANILNLYCEEGQPHNYGKEAQYDYYAQLDAFSSNVEYFYINQHILSEDDSFTCLNRCDLKGNSCRY
ncbi:MAG: hypothetical protein MJ200_05700 [Mycoplasmoidaceae bacterium]|nr:hypothetical protein [Mycoplasmoidaceae bacterium]